MHWINSDKTATIQHNYQKINKVKIIHVKLFIINYFSVLLLSSLLLFMIQQNGSKRRVEEKSGRNQHIGIHHLWLLNVPKMLSD